ncbi:hypothetical protein E2493_14500 [Sphingomonas parva]|uniref:Uncharacterized protein n=1 Tax=Sphingomonas parva TaxID=2555898 RepID=A0A4Y8ZNG5_9SPHN|nr:hypothetical protein [Sphingomonas parva]TFI57573.1 hypothetical protein E2493_14500 [Sphingomonas parva]
MPISSYIVEEGNGRGKGHTQHGNGKGVGHTKHQHAAMDDGEYTIVISGINHDNPTPVDQTSAPTTLADGSQMWTEVRQGSISTGTAPALGGDSSALRLETDTNNGRLRLNDAFTTDQQIKLGDLEDLSFDYYIQSSTRTDVTPVIRLAIDADGNLATTGDRGELVFEYAYQGLGPTTTGSWQHADLAGADWNAWQRSGGQNRDGYPNIVPLSDWADASGYTPVGGPPGALHFDENSLVLGWSVAYGSGNGTGVMYLDNLQVGGVTYEFG